MSPRPAPGATPVTSNNPSEEDTVTKPTRTYTRNRIDYSLLFDWLTSQPGNVVSHDDLLGYLSSVGRADEFPHYRKALNYLSRPVSTESLRYRHKVRGLVLSTSRGRFVYDPKAVITHSDSTTTRVLSRVVNPDPGVPRRLFGPRSGEPTLIVYNRPSDVPVVRVERPAPKPVVEPPAPAFPLAEVLADNDGTLVLRHEDGTVIVANVTARTTLFFQNS